MAEPKDWDAVMAEVTAVEAVVFDGGGKSEWEPGYYLKKYAAAIPRLVAVHEEISTSRDERVEELFDRIYIMARSIIETDGSLRGDLYIHDSPLALWWNLDVRYGLVERMRHLAQRGRESATHKCLPLVERVAAQRIFLVNEEPYAIQIRFPQAGCSASICSNCYEIVGFGQPQCVCCKLDFIGPFYTPTCEEWAIMRPERREYYVLETFKRKNNGRLDGPSR